MPKYPEFGNQLELLLVLGSLPTEPYLSSLLLLLLATDLNFGSVAIGAAIFDDISAW